MNDNNNEEWSNVNKMIIIMCNENDNNEYD